MCLPALSHERCGGVPRSRTVGTSGLASYPGYGGTRVTNRGRDVRRRRDLRACTSAATSSLALAHHDVALELEAGRELAALLGPLVGAGSGTCGSTRPWTPPCWRPRPRSRSRPAGRGRRRGPRPSRSSRAARPRSATASRSRVTSAAMNGWPSPTTRHWSTSGVRADPVLEDGRGDVLAAGGHEDLLLAAGDPDEALVVDLADVAGVEPAVAPRAPRRSRRRCASSR